MLAIRLQNAPDTAVGLRILTSVLAHAVLLVILVLLLPRRGVEPPPTGAVTVDVLSEEQFALLTKPVMPIEAASPLVPPPDVTPEPPAVTPGQEASVKRPAKVPTSPSETQGASTGAMTRAASFFAAGILRDPSNAQVRQTLPLLAMDERITQLCSIEALEQLRLAQPGTLPDSLVPSAFADTSLVDGRLLAPRGAYREGRSWYYVRFECVAGADLESVAEFSFELGEVVPENLWESHNLIAEDFDDD